MNEFTRTLLDTDGQTLVDFILFCQFHGRTPNENNLNWFLWQRETNNPKAFLSKKKNRLDTSDYN